MSIVLSVGFAPVGSWSGDIQSAVAVAMRALCNHIVIFINHTRKPRALVRPLLPFLRARGRSIRERPLVWQRRLVAATSCGSRVRRLRKPSHPRASGARGSGADGVDNHEQHLRAGARDRPDQGTIMSPP